MNQTAGVKLSPIQMPMSQEEQAAELRKTVWCRIGPSQVHGVGVIAIRDIKKGQQIFCSLTVKPTWHTISYEKLNQYLNFGEFKPIYDLIIDRWPNVINKSAFLNPNYDARLTSFMNHNANANYDPTTDCALADINAGEEVFEDYRVIENWEKVHPWIVKSDKKKK